VTIINSAADTNACAVDDARKQPDCSPDLRCPTCDKAGLFAYRNTKMGEMTWYCEDHRLATYWADARRDGSTHHLVYAYTPGRPSVTSA